MATFKNPLKKLFQNNTTPFYSIEDIDEESKQFIRKLKEEYQSNPSAFNEQEIAAINQLNDRLDAPKDRFQEIMGMSYADRPRDFKTDRAIMQGAMSRKLKPSKDLLSTLDSRREPKNVLTNVESVLQEREVEKEVQQDIDNLKAQKEEEYSRALGVNPYKDIVTAFKNWWDKTKQNPEQAEKYIQKYDSETELKEAFKQSVEKGDLDKKFDVSISKPKTQKKIEIDRSLFQPVTDEPASLKVKQDVEQYNKTPKLERVNATVLNVADTLKKYENVSEDFIKETNNPYASIFTPFMESLGATKSSKSFVGSDGKTYHYASFESLEKAETANKKMIEQMINARGGDIEQTISDYIDKPLDSEEVASRYDEITENEESEKYLEFRAIQEQEFEKNPKERDIYQAWSEFEWSDIVPFYSSSKDAAKLAMAIKYIADFKSGKQLTPSQIDFLTEYSNDERFKDSEFKAKVFDAITQSIPLMGEIALTYGIGSLTVRGSRRLLSNKVKKEIKDYIEKGLLINTSSRLIKGGAFLTGASLTTAGWLKVGSFDDKIKLEKQLPGFEFANDGILITQEGMPEHTAQKQATFEAATEFLTEIVGGRFLKVAFPFLGKATDRLASGVYNKLSPGQTEVVVSQSLANVISDSIERVVPKSKLSKEARIKVRQYMQLTGYDGFLEELGEERLGDATRELVYALSQAKDAEGNPILPDFDNEQYIDNVFRDLAKGDYGTALERVGVEVASIGFVGLGLRSSTVGALNTYDKAKEAISKRVEEGKEQKLKEDFPQLIEERDRLKALNKKNDKKYTKLLKKKKKTKKDTEELEKISDDIRLEQAVTVLENIVKENPKLSETLDINIVDEVVEITKDELEAEGKSLESQGLGPGVEKAKVLGSNYEKRVGDNLKLAININRGADFDTSLEEFMEAVFKGGLSEKEVDSYQEYYDIYASREIARKEINQEINKRLPKGKQIDPDAILSQEELFSKEGRAKYYQDKLTPKTFVERLYTGLKTRINKIIGNITLDDKVREIYEKAGAKRVELKADRIEKIRLKREQREKERAERETDKIERKRARLKPGVKPSPEETFDFEPVKVEDTESVDIPETLEAPPEKFRPEIKRLEKLEPKIYHETSLSKALNISKSSSIITDLNVSKDIDLALGQSGKGVIIEFDENFLREYNPKSINFLNKTKKPSTKFFEKFGKGAKEFTLGPNVRTPGLQAIKKLIIGKDVKKIAPKQRRALKNSFDITEQKDGTLIATPKKIPTKKKDISYQLSVLDVSKKLANPKEVTEEDKVNVAVQQGLKEVIKAIDDSDEGTIHESLRWYGTRFQETLDLAGEEVRLDTPEDDLFLTTIIGIQSQGAEVEAQYNTAINSYNYYDENGTFDYRKSPNTGKPVVYSQNQKGKDVIVGGVQPGALLINHKKLESIVEKFGKEKAMNWLITKHTGKEIQEVLESVGLKRPSHIKVGGEYYGSRIFGRKIGNFISNLAGKSDVATYDRWWVRTWNRWLGTPIRMEKGEEKVQESPRGNIEEDLMNEAIDRISNTLTDATGYKFTPPAVQAVLWYYEKELYIKNDARVPEGLDYLGAAESRAKEKGYATTPKSTKRARRVTEQRIAKEKADTASLKEGIKKTGKKARQKAPQVSYQLTPAQKEFFKDTKVVDSKGEPKVVYHGTTEDFDRFEPGSWFSEDPQLSSIYYAEGSNARIIPVYLNIENPIEFTELGEVSEGMDVDNFISNVEYLVDSKMPKKAKDKLKGLVEYSDALYDYANAFRDPLLKNWAEKAGYDGIKVEEEYPLGLKPAMTYMAFNANQIKSATAMADKPTKDPRISYQLTPAQKEFFKDTKVVDSKGNPKVVYHGTSEDFDAFYPGSYFTSNPEYASQIALMDSEDVFASQNVKAVYLNIKNPKRYKDDDYEDHVMIGPNSPDIDGLAKQGYDGIIYEDGTPDDIFIAFYPNQVKSATAMADKPTKDPRISYQLVPASQPKDVYDAVNRPLKAGKRPVDARVGFIGASIIPISTLLKRIDPKIYSTLLKHQFNTTSKITEAQKYVLELEKLIKQFNKTDQTKFKLAMHNSDLGTMQEMASTTKKSKEFLENISNIRDILDSLREQLIELGEDVGYIEGYFPRKPNDYDGLITELYGEEKVKSFIEKQYAAKEKKDKIKLDNEQKAAILNQLFKGYNYTNNKPSFLKTRVFDTITADMYPFYEDAVVQLNKHMESAIEKIETKKFFGAGELTDESIGNFIEKISEGRNLTQSQVEDLIRILSAYFNFQPTNSKWSAVKTGTYGLLLGKFSNVVTQLQDIVYSIYENGLDQGTTLKNISKYLTGKIPLIGNKISYSERITRERAGIENPAFELKNKNKEWYEKLMNNATNTIFNLSLFKLIDGLGKSVLLNSSIQRYKRKAQKNRLSKKDKDYLKLLFGGSYNEIISDLKKDVRPNDYTSNEIFLAYSTVLKYQPIGKTEVPLNYLESGAIGRTAYMLKTFSLKQLNVLRDDFMDVIFEPGKKRQMLKFKVRLNPKTSNKQKAEALWNLLSLVTLISLAGGGAEEIKDWLKNRDESFWDNVQDNFLKIMLINKFWVDKVERDSVYKGKLKSIEDNLMDLVVSAPPVDVGIFLFDGIADAIEIAQGKSAKKAKSTRMIPFVGDYLYGRRFYEDFTGTAEGTQDKIKKVINKMTGRGADDYTYYKIRELYKKSKEEKTLNISEVKKLTKFTLDLLNNPQFKYRKVPGEDREELVERLNPKKFVNHLESEYNVKIRYSEKTKKYYKGS